MKKEYSVELLDPVLTVPDIDFNEVKYRALINEIERDLILLQMKRAAHNKHVYDEQVRQERESQIKGETSAKPSLISRIVTKLTGGTPDG